jgi:hypothetical protein
MLPGDVLGRRRPDGTDTADLLPGDYCRRGTMWWVCLPTGVVGHLDAVRWAIVEHDDGTLSAGDPRGATITVNPSIHDAPAGWHGHLQRGVWREC